VDGDGVGVGEFIKFVEFAEVVVDLLVWRVRGASG